MTQPTPQDLRALRDRLYDVVDASTGGPCWQGAMANYAEALEEATPVTRFRARNNL